MNKSRTLGMLAFLAAMAESKNNPHESVLIEYSETEIEKRERLQAHKIKLYKKRGLSEFSYIGGKVWALNQKSADKKAIKLGYK